MAPPLGGPRESVPWARGRCGLRPPCPSNTGDKLRAPGRVPELQTRAAHGRAPTSDTQQVSALGQGARQLHRLVRPHHEGLTPRTVTDGGPCACAGELPTPAATAAQTVGAPAPRPPLASLQPAPTARPATVAPIPPFPLLRPPTPVPWARSSETGRHTEGDASAGTAGT